ncbi:hypothetical protein Q5P01_020174 [Channa striata]|uniref:IQ domain-containing protein C n=1 Tax=Channa striata TaxID=64152 RepID=A0AA88LZB3_CHASR|nr:hypothetical protein Q5P01_020174 [Channa striata]
MDRTKWEKMLTHFQAFARGYLIRTEVRRAREEFEDIVKEIDGRSSHLQWRDAVISVPHFTDNQSLFPRPRSSSSRPSNPGLNASASPQSLSAGATTCLSQEKGSDRHVLLEKMEAERDESQSKHQRCSSKDYIPSTIVVEDGESQRQKIMREEQGDDNEGMIESIEESSSVWSSLDLDLNIGHSQIGSQQYCLVKEVPQTPEALRLHRNTLSMELVWLQQAIDSRKKYLSLKDRLSKSEKI